VYNGEVAEILVGQEMPHEVRLDETVESKLTNVTTVNYKDVGIGLDFRMAGAGFYGGDGTLSFGTQYYKREYPNYVSLLDLATGIGVEKDEKDYHGILVRAGYYWMCRRSGISPST